MASYASNSGSDSDSETRTTSPGVQMQSKSRNLNVVANRSRASGTLLQGRKRNDKSTNQRQGSVTTGLNQQLTETAGGSSGLRLQISPSSASPSPSGSTSPSALVSTLFKDVAENPRLELFQSCFNTRYVPSDTQTKTNCILCDHEWNGSNNKSTLWRHLQMQHKVVYEKLIPFRPTRRGKRLIFQEAGKILLDETRKDLVRLVAAGRPLCIIRDEGMQNMLSGIEAYAQNEPIGRYLKRRANGTMMAAPPPKKRSKTVDQSVSDSQTNSRPPKPMVLTRNLLLRDIEDLAQKVRAAISLEIEESDSLVSLMIDIASRHGHSTLGISIQYKTKLNWKTVTRTIGMIRLTSSHTGQLICDKVKETLDIYNIDVNRIYAMTTDSGKNVLKSCRDLRALLNGDDSNTVIEDDDQYWSEEESSQSQADHHLQRDIQSGNNMLNDLAAIAVSPSPSTSSSNTNASEMENVTESEQIRDFQNLFTSNSADVAVPVIESLLCGAHSLQLCVEKAIDNFEKKNRNGLIAKCRNIVRILRTQNFCYIRENAGHKLGALLDVATRWNSKFTMVNNNISYNISSIFYG